MKKINAFIYLLVAAALMFTFSQCNGGDNTSTAQVTQKNLVLFGPPGAGKSTQAGFIVDHYGLEKLESGAIFRQNISDETPLGLRVQQFVNAGELVPDSLVNRIILGELSDDRYRNGFVIDGFPRTIPQAEALQTFLTIRRMDLDAVVHLEVPEEELQRRILGRDDDRDDDDLETFRARMETYRNETKPLLDFYEERDLLITVDGTGTPEEVSQRILRALQ
ncbi:MAG: adenylate kinase [Balneolaceae bacterium]